MCVHFLTEYQTILDGSHSVAELICMEKSFTWTDNLDDLSTDEGFQQLNYLHVKHEIG